VQAAAGTAAAQERERILPSSRSGRHADDDARALETRGQVARLGGREAQHLARAARRRRPLSRGSRLTDKTHRDRGQPDYEQEGVYLSFGVPPQSGEGVVQGRDPAGI
jgi:hypothetical protein